MHKPITTLKTDRNLWTPEALLEVWHHSLHEKDRSAGTIKKYTQAVARFLTSSTACKRDQARVQSGK